MELEINSRAFDGTAEFNLGGTQVLMTPPIGEDYWLFRVRLSKTQAVIGFHKFGTIGIGFAKESDWNTNLPWSSSAAEIFAHIKHNKGSKKIEDSDCIAAIELIRESAKQYFKTRQKQPAGG